MANGQQGPAWPPPQMGNEGQAPKFGGLAPGPHYGNSMAGGLPIGISSFMPQIPQAQFNKLLGEEPWQDWRTSWWMAGKMQVMMRESPEIKNLEKSNCI